MDKYVIKCENKEKWNQKKTKIFPDNMVRH